MVKASDTSGRSAADRDLAIRQIVNGAVASTEIVDILSAAGLSSPDISILSDEFLAEIGQMEKKNLALEALKKLLDDEIRSRSRSNVIETRKFSERLEEAISCYHTNAISTVEVLQELIALAKEVREARNRCEETGLTPEEIAFYDSLADNQSAVDTCQRSCIDAKSRVSCDSATNARTAVRFGSPPPITTSITRRNFTLNRESCNRSDFVGNDRFNMANRSSDSVAACVGSPAASAGVPMIAPARRPVLLASGQPKLNMLPQFRDASGSALPGLAAMDTHPVERRNTEPVWSKLPVPGRRVQVVRWPGFGRVDLTKWIWLTGFG